MVINNDENSWFLIIKVNQESKVVSREKRLFNHMFSEIK